MTANLIQTATYTKRAFPPKSPQCRVFDMDDTLCHYDDTQRLSKCGNFAPRQDLLKLALDSQAAGQDIVIATARPCWTLKATTYWLLNNGIKPRAIYLKNRDNHEVTAHDLKTEMLRDIMKTYEVISFHDDSPFNVKAARDIGVNAIHVPGNEAYWKERGEAEGWKL